MLTKNNAYRDRESGTDHVASRRIQQMWVLLSALFVRFLGGISTVAFGVVSVTLNGEEFQNSVVPLDVILNAWAEGQLGSPNVTVHWKRVPHSVPLSKLNATLLSSSSETEPTHRLQISGDDFELYSWRLPPPQIPQGRDFDVTREVFDNLPERSLSSYAFLLKSHFGVPPPSVEFQEFVRQFSGGLLNDYWLPEEKMYPRATLHRLPEYGSDNWALLRFETDENEQCASLDSFAALLAFRPTLTSLFAFSASNCNANVSPTYVCGESCLGIVEVDPITNNSRHWFVSEKSPYTLYRFVGKTKTQGVLVDLHWDGSGDTSEIAGWEICQFHMDDTPVQYWGKSVVTKMDRHSFSDSPIQQIIDLGPGTWVMDYREDKQYLVSANGAKRLILPEELAWLPLQPELAESESGQVSRLIASKIWWRKTWGFFSIYKLLAVLIGVYLIGSYAIYFRKHRRSLGSIGRA